MADMKIDRSIFSVPADEPDFAQNLGIDEERTSLPEWRGWDRIENSALDQAPLVLGLELNVDLGPALEQVRNEPEYTGLIDLDDKRILYDVLNNVSTKLDSLVENSGSERLANFQESLNDLLEMYQSAYFQQIGSIKG